MAELVAELERTEEVPAPAPVRGDDRLAFAALARLAASLSRPQEGFDAAHWSAIGLTPGEVRRIAAHPAFAAPVSHAVAATLGLDGIELSRDEAWAIAGTGPGRLSILLVSEPVGELHAAALLAAAAVTQRGALRMTRKEDRQRLRAALGDQPYQLATQEAPTLYPGLARIAPEGAFERAMGAAAEPAAMRQAFVDIGLELLARIVSTCAPKLSVLMELRLPPHPCEPDRGALAAQDLRQLTKLIRRRMPRWAAIIA